MASTTLSSATVKTSSHRRRILRENINWLFVIPALIFFIGFSVYPIIHVLIISFTDYRYLNITDPTNFVGLKNYIDALQDPKFQTGIGRAIYFTALFLPGVIFIPLFLAVLVDRVKSPGLSTFYRLILLIPAVIPGPMIFVLWRWMYDYEVGPINTILVNMLHLFTARGAPQWVGDSPLSIPAIALMEWWWGLGYHTMFFLAGLASIPREMTEAARVDGANEWQLFWKITVPRLRPIMIILVVLRFGTAMAVIEEFIIMGGMSSNMPTYTWTVYMWDMAFNLGSWPQGYAAAMGWLGALSMLVVVAFLFYIFRDQDG